MNDFNAAVRRILRRQGIGITTLADLVDRSDSNVQQCLKRGNPTLEVLTDIATALNMKPWQLLREMEAGPTDPFS